MKILMMVYSRRVAFGNLIFSQMNLRGVTEAQIRSKSDTFTSGTLAFTYMYVRKTDLLFGLRDGNFPRKSGSCFLREQIEIVRNHGSI